jgi:hypothetical protein
MYECNRPQQWLHQCWGDFVQRVQATRPHIVILQGDMIQGTNPRDGQLITNKADIQQRAAYELLAPIRAACDTMYYVRGTEWHEGKAAEDVELLAERLDCRADPSSGQRSWWELYLDVGGPVLHCAHHVGVSSVPWYEATVPLRDTLMQLAELWRFYGEHAPNVRLVARSHRHRFVHVQAPPDLQVFVTPAWQLKTAFSHKRASSMLPQIGWVVVDWDGAELVVKPRIYPLPRLHVEALV